ncbi:MAG: hypothetical protein J6F30_08855 [Cellulosilyticum sp.]|nr:hypothetical protein [Cellulosilyticum sp.]
MRGYYLPATYNYNGLMVICQLHSATFKHYFADKIITTVIETIYYVNFIIVV